MSLLVKYNENGDPIWTLRAGGDGYDSFKAVTVDSKGFIYVTGAVSQNSDIGSFTFTNPSDTDVVVAKISPTGTVIWAERFGGPGPDYGNSIALDANGAIYVTGAFSNTFDYQGQTFASNGGLDIFVIKYDPSGQLDWVKTYGGTFNDYGNGIATDNLNFSITTGCFNTNTEFGDGNQNNQGRPEASRAIARDASNLGHANYAPCRRPVYMKS